MDTEKQMTVADVIAKLQAMPQDLPIFKEYDGSLQEPKIYLSTDANADTWVIPSGTEPCVVII